MVKSRKRKSRRKSRKRRSRKCKHGELKKPVRDNKSGKMRYCKKAPRKSRRKSVRKSRRKSKGRRSRKCKYGELKKSARDKKTGRMRYCKKAPRKSRRKSRRKSKRKKKSRSTFIHHKGRRVKATLKPEYVEWLNVRKNLHTANRKQRKEAKKVVEIMGKIMILKKNLNPLQLELKGLLKYNRANKAIATAVESYGSKAIMLELNKNFLESRLRDSGLYASMDVSGELKRTRSF